MSETTNGKYTVEIKDPLLNKVKKHKAHMSAKNESESISASICDLAWKTCQIQEVMVRNIKPTTKVTLINKILAD